MTFRDDHDAALARIAALEGEVERLTAERDALADRVKALEEEQRAKPKPKPPKPKPKPAPKPSDDTKESKRAAIVWGALGVVVTALMVGVPAYRDCGRADRRAAWREQVEAREAHKVRWRALVGVEPCLRDTAYDALFARQNTPDKIDPRERHVWSFHDRLIGACDAAKTLAKDPKTPAPVRDALYAWLEVQSNLEPPAKALGAYYGNQDWKEDNFAGAAALWAPVLALLDRRAQAIERVRRDAVPAIRAELRELQRAELAAHGRTEGWYRAELGLAMWDLADRGYEAAGIYAGREPDLAAAAAAMRAPMVALLAATKEAPIELRRLVRKLDWITEPVAAGRGLSGETPLWHFDRGASDVFGRMSDHVLALPPDPGPAPPDPD